MVGTCSHIKYLAGFFLALGMVLLLIAPPVQAATVTLSSTTSPSSGQPGTTNISVTGSGFPTGTIPVSNVTVTLQPPGSGAGVATTASAVKTIAGPVRQVSFQIPASVVVSVASTYQVSIAGTTSTGVAFSSGNTSALTVLPAASIISVSPMTGQPGQTLSVTITGSGTNFVQGSTYANFGGGISVGGAPAGTFGPVIVTSATTAVANITIAGKAAASSQTVVVDPGGQQAALTNAFTIAAPPALITEIENVITLDSVNVSNSSSPQKSFSIQQNCYIGAPLPNNGISLPWVQNVLQVDTGAFPNLTITPVVAVQTKPIATLASFQATAPATLSLITQAAQDTVIFSVYLGGRLQSSYSLSVSNIVSEFQGGAYIAYTSSPTSPDPPEFVLVGTENNSTATFLANTTGSVISQIVMGGQAALVQEEIRNMPSIACPTGALCTETSEGSAGLPWCGVGTSWTTATTASAVFNTGATCFAAAGIWFEPANGIGPYLADNFVSDFSNCPAGSANCLNTSLWKTSSNLLNSLAAASSSPPASFVTPQLNFSAAGMEMSGVNGFFETAGLQSWTTFTAPFTVQATVEGTEAAGNPFEIFLVSADLSQFLTVSGNLSASNGGYYGIWTTAPNVSQLWQLGEQLQPPTLAAPNTEYTINITVNANGTATVSVLQSDGTLSGGASNLQPGTGPFYLVLGQREGLPFNGPGPNVAYWGSVSVIQH